MYYFEKLKNNPLFYGIKNEEFSKMLRCLVAFEKKYKKNEFVIHAGEVVQNIGVVLEGSINVIQEDFWGRRTILTNITPGGIFGEAFVCGGAVSISVSVIASTDVHILLLDFRKIMEEDFVNCPFQQKLTKNMLKIVAEKNIFLTDKMEQLSKRNIREKIMSFLSYQSLNQGRNDFYITFDRQELADYLAVDRSALSSVLTALKSEGLIDFKKNYFVLKK